MIPEKVFHQILALDEGWRVAEVDYVAKEGKVLIGVEETPKVWREQTCPHCGSRDVRGYDHAPQRRWRHLNVCQLDSWIVCAPPRGRCVDCGKVYTVRVPWEGRSKGLTQEFEAFALTLMREMPVSKAGEILGESDQKLWRALFAHVDAAWRDLSWEDVIWVGADEMNRRKGHNYLTVFVDLIEHRVLLAVEGKDASVWEEFAVELLRHNGHPKAITRVAIDMSAAYQKGVRSTLSNAHIVFDKFHVIRQVGEALEQVRRKEARQNTRARNDLKNTRWLWNKNPERWTEKEIERYEHLKDKPLVTGLAYAMRLDLQAVYTSGTVAQARRRFKEWCRWVRQEAGELGSDLLEPMSKAADMVERHLEGILAHWEAGLTTALLEGLNSLFSATKRKARGYRSSLHQTAMLYFVAGKLNIPHFR